MIDSGDSVITNASGIRSVRTVPQLVAMAKIYAEGPALAGKLELERNRLNLDDVEHADKHFANPS